MNNNYAPQYPPLPLNMVVTQNQINVDPLSEDEKKEILKRQKLAQERAKLKPKIDKMNALKRKQKLAEEVFKNKKKKRKKKRVNIFNVIVQCFFF